MASLDNMVEKIIQKQELVIGPLAWIEARKVPGLHIDTARKVTFVGGAQDQKEIVDRLVNQYERLFGRVSHEVCREAVTNMLASMQPSEIPLSLRT